MTLADAPQISFHAARCLRGERLRPTRFTVDSRGQVASIADRDQPVDSDQILDGVVVPAMANVHSHAFQRAMAGTAEWRAHAGDDFWSWREAMYRVAAQMDPERLYPLARALYEDMIAAGYSQVSEFHYLHQATRGDALPLEMADALIAAADSAGIRLTLLPVLYQRGGFDLPLSERQRDFALATDRWLALVDSLAGRESLSLKVGLAFHSLRAVELSVIASVLATRRAAAPVHLHISEQHAEVEQCRAALGATPIHALLDAVPVDRHWALIHATHASASELTRLAPTGAVVGLCPTTEANLGDGLFDLPTWRDLQGPIAIGSDSQISVDVAEELRWLEYGQRLRTHRRCVLATAQQPDVSLATISACAAGGWQVSGFGQALVPGGPADFLHLPSGASHWVYVSPCAAAPEVYVGGRRRA